MPSRRGSSLGIDLGFGQPMEHVLGQCVLALRIADKAGLDDDEKAVVYYTALIVNVGCHVDAHEQAKWFGDDIALRAMKYEHDQRSAPGAAAALRDAVASSYERWEGRGWPGALKTEQVPIATRLSQFAEFVEVANRLGGVPAAVRLATDRAGAQFDPDLCELFCAHADEILQTAEPSAPGARSSRPSPRLASA
jgi:hypothetical protein